MFVISLFGCPPCIGCRGPGRRPVRPPLCTPLLRCQYLLFLKDNITAALTIRIWHTLRNVLFFAMSTVIHSYVLASV